MARKRERQITFGPILTMVITIILVMVLSFIFSKLGLTTNKSEIISGEISTSNISVNNALSKEGISYLFSNILENFKNLNVIYAFIVAMIGIGFANSSGLFKKTFKNAKKFKLSFVIVLTLVSGCILGKIGLNSYALLLPLAAYIYKNLGKNPLVGLITMFIALTMGQAASILPTYLNQNMGLITEEAAKITVDANYAFNSSSLIYITLGSFVLFVFVGKIIIDKYLVPKLPKQKNEEEIEELEVEHNGLKKSNIAFIIMLILLIYAIIPGLPLSGGLLGNGNNYLEKLLGDTSPFKESFVFLISLMLVICGSIYGFASKKFKNLDDFTRGFSESLSGLSLAFIFMFLISELTSVLKYTNLDTFLVSTLVNWLSNLEITGLGLILIFFLVTIIISVIIPDTMTKWSFVGPIIVPLLMRANMSASFAQFIFTVADGIGKSFSLIFPFTAILFGLIYKYTDSGDYGFIRVYKLFSPLIILFIVIWIVIIITWYVVGIPIGIGVLPSL